MREGDGLVPEFLVGTWEGQIDVAGQVLEIQVRFSWNPDVGSISIPAQGARDLPLTPGPGVSAFASNTRISFVLQTGGPEAVFNGTWTEDAGITGSFTQGPAEGRFSLQRSESEPGSAAAGSSGTGQPDPRPGTEVTLTRDGVTLAATLVEPRGGSSPDMPIAIIVAGSGPTDRDGNSPLLPGRNNGLRELAEALADAGVATLRYDKRGIAGSPAPEMREEDLRIDDLAADLLAWAQWSREAGITGPLYFVGHSEGALVSLIAATAPGDDGLLTAAPEVRERLAGVITLAGAADRFDRLILGQLSAQFPSDGEVMRQARTALEALAEGRTTDVATPELQAILRPSVQPYLISVIARDPLALAGALPVPLLAVGGGADIQVPAGDADRLAEAAGDGRALVLESMSHVLKQAEPGNPASQNAAYSDPSVPLAEGLVEAIAEFIGETASSG